MSRLSGLNDEERALVRAALIIAEGRCSEQGNKHPAFSEEREVRFRNADKFRALFDKLVEEVPVVNA